MVIVSDFVISIFHQQSLVLAYAIFTMVIKTVAIESCLEQNYSYCYFTMLI